MSTPPESRWLVTGITSIHGWPIFRSLMSCYGDAKVFGVRPPGTMSPSGANVAAVCLGDRSALEVIRDAFRPDVVIHAGGVCDLDVCEARPGWARERNVGAASVVMQVFQKSCHIVYLGTDLVFSGSNPPPGGYVENDAIDPISVVGRTYAEAEAIVRLVCGTAVVRLGLPTGASIQGAKGAVDWIEGRFKRGLRATLFHDEFRSCIDCDDLARYVIAVAERRVRGIYHLGGPRALSLYEMGELIIKRGDYPSHLLEGRFRCDEVDGPPRIGNVALNSTRIETLLGRPVPLPALN